MQTQPEIDIARLCELSHIVITPEEMPKFRRQIENAVGNIRKLDELDLEGVESTVYGQPPAGSAFRTDTVVSWQGVDSAMANAPERVNNEIKVPRIME